MARWKASDLKALERKKLKTNLDKQAPRDPKLPKISVEKETIKKVLWVLKREGTITDYVEEHQFDAVRQFRFDWAILDHKIAIEYEGIISAKSGHTTITGYTKDCIKYNLAIQNGWRVLRYTALNYKNLYDDVLNLLKK